MKKYTVRAKPVFAGVFCLKNIGFICLLCCFLGIASRADRPKGRHGFAIIAMAVAVLGIARARFGPAPVWVLFRWQSCRKIAYDIATTRAAVW